MLIVVVLNFSLKDIGMDFKVVAESFETSAPWDRVVNVVNNTKGVLHRECVGMP